MSSKQKELWITNISKQDIHLSDLGVVIKSQHTINLLDHKHYHLTEDQVNKSITSGSILKRSGKIIIRKMPPVINKPHTIHKIEIYKYGPKKSGVKIIEERFEELSIEDNDFIDLENELLNNPNVPLKKEK